MTAAEKLTLVCEAHLAAARELLAQILSVQGPRTQANTLEPLNEIAMHVNNGWEQAHLHLAMHPEESVRSAAGELEQRFHELETDLNLDRRLYEAFQAVDIGPLDPQARRYVEHTLRDFHRAGVDRNEATRQQLRELSNREGQLGQEFDRVIREDLRSIRLAPARLAGLPEDYVRAHPPGEDGLVTITTSRPDFDPFLTYAEDADARRELQVAYLDRAWPANDETLKQLLAVRWNKARLLGYRDSADYATEDQMTRSGRRVEEFIDQMAEATGKGARRDYQILLERKRRDDPQAELVDAWDLRYYVEIVRRERFLADARELRLFLDVERCREGLLQVSAELFGLEYRSVPEAARWHEEVHVYDVLQDGAKLGRIYLDLYPRPEKFKGGACMPLVTGVAGRQLPEGVLVCNLPRGLLEHESLVMLFHEFGHLMHHLLGGRQRWLRFSGIMTERDFAETPSQVFEEWAWDADVLRRFAAHRDTGEPIPPELVDRWRAAADFARALSGASLLPYVALSLRLHQVEPAGLDTTALLFEQQQKYSPIPPAEGTHPQASFAHLLHYSARYYTYDWSCVIARDLLSQFRKGGLMDLETARRYRDAVLVPGGSKDAAELIRDFLGRDFSFDAFRDWLEQPAA